MSTDTMPRIKPDSLLARLVRFIGDSGKSRRQTRWAMLAAMARPEGADLQRRVGRPIDPR